MAEVLGIVTGVLGLFPLVRDGLEMIRDIFGSARTLDLAVGRIDLQLLRYDEWRDIWVSEDGELDVAFQYYAKDNAGKARVVRRQLASMAQTLFDVDALEVRWGIKATDWPERDPKDLSRFKLHTDDLTLDTQSVFTSHCRHNLAYIKRCQFVFSRTAMWTNLISLVKSLNETLVTFGPRLELGKQKKVPYTFLSVMEAEELKSCIESSTWESRHTEDPDTAKWYSELALAAAFSQVVRFERKHAAYKFTLRDFRIEESYSISGASDSTMALLFDYPSKKEHRVVIIEWLEGGDVDEAKLKTLMLAPPKPDVLLLPKCYGMIEDTANRRVGLVLAPPSHIRGSLPSILPQGAISQKRMPVSLRELIEKRHPSCTGTLELGMRFRLAKKLVDAVGLMHCVGWVHKNIRSNCIIFFPSSNASGHGPAEEHPQPLSYSEPMFVGLGDPQFADVSNGLVEENGEFYAPPFAPSYPQQRLDNDAWSDEESEEESYHVNSVGQPIVHIAPPAPQRRPSHGRRYSSNRSVPHFGSQQHNMARHVQSPSFGRSVGMRGGGLDPEGDVYEHPEKRYNPSVRYSRAHDIYSLGVVLLEIGMWEPVSTVVDIGDDDFERCKRGVENAALQLDGLTGSIYGDVVQRCLAVNTRERTEADLRELSGFLAEIAVDLGKCWA